MKLTQIAVLLSGAALSASVFAADDHLGIPHYGDENDLASWYRPIAKPAFSSNDATARQVVRFGDENDTSWLTPTAKPAFISNNAAAAVGRIPHDLDENALAMGSATTVKPAFTANYGVRGNGAGL